MFDGPYTLVAGLRRVKHPRVGGSSMTTGVRGRFSGMAALIEFVCIATHARHGDPSITFEQRAWAYCAAGGNDGHQWSRIDPTAVETLRSPAGNGRPHLAPEESNEHTLTGRPAR